MNEMRINDVEYIVKNYTFERQLEQAVEEASEFILAAQKYKRYGSDETVTNLVEETGDLLICMEEMRLYLGSVAVDDSIDFKLARERMRILEWLKHPAGTAEMR